MSAYTTLHITKSKATQKLFESLCLEVDVGLLEKFMDDILEKRLYNCVIVPDTAIDNDDKLV